MLRQGIFLAIVLAITFSLSACDVSSEKTVPTPTPKPAPILQPAMFEVTTLDIKPLEAVAGETVNITAVVKNIGGSEGIYDAILTVDSAVIEIKEIAIVPGSSKVISFSIIKDTPGIYEIGIGELTSNLVVIKKELELKYDDGTSDGAWAIGVMGRGHVVHFSSSTIPFVITQVKIYGSLYGFNWNASPPYNTSMQALIEVWDKNLNILYSCLVPHSKFRTEPDWVTVDIPDIMVDGEFYIFVCTSSPKQGGLQIHYDSGATNLHSEVTKARHISDWYLETPKEKVNWMIRVNGTKTELPITSEPSVKEVELKYDTGISTRLANTTGPGWGFSVYFSPPTTPFTNTKVKLFACLRTGYQKDTAVIQIWDEDFNVVYSCDKPAKEFPPRKGYEGSWVTINIPNINVNGDFRVILFTNGKNVSEGGQLLIK